MGISHILYGFTLGFALIPVWLALIDYGLSKGTKTSLKVVYGSVVANLIYLVILFLGVGALLEDKMVRKIVIIIGSMILVLIGLKSFWGYLKNKKVTHSKYAFRKGFWLTLMNPMPLLFWAYLSLPTIKEAVFNLELFPLINAAFALAGVLLFFVLINFLIAKFRKKFSKKTVYIISIIFSIVYIGIGIYGFYVGYVA